MNIVIKKYKPMTLILVLFMLFSSLALVYKSEAAVNLEFIEHGSYASTIVATGHDFPSNTSVTFIVVGAEGTWCTGSSVVQSNGELEAFVNSSCFVKDHGGDYTIKYSTDDRVVRGYFTLIYWDNEGTYTID